MVFVFATVAAGCVEAAVHFQTPPGSEEIRDKSGDSTTEIQADGKKFIKKDLLKWQPVAARLSEKEPNTVIEPYSTPTPAPTPGTAKSADEIANQIQNPAAPVTLLQFRNIMLPNVPGLDGVSNEMQIQFVKPIMPSKHIPFLQLMRITLPVASLPGPFNKKGLGDMQFFDLFSIKTKWGNWGFGPALVFPTATSKALGAGKWQAGPSFAVIVTKIKNWTIGSIFQNPISFAGDKTRPGVNNLIISPTVTYNIPKRLVPGYWKQGWFVGLADFSTTINWKNGVSATVPLGLQLGRVFHIRKQPFSASVEAGGTVKRPPNTPPPGLLLGFEFGIIFK